jgi:ABC-2 type transport system ATP-binding protein
MIQVQNLTKIYGVTPAIENLHFSVEKGEIVGFLGPNGAGKTTTMRILAGSLGATAGNALIGGVDVFRDPRTVKQMVGYLPETPPLYTDMTVRAYLRFCARVKRAENPRRAVEDIVERVGLKTVAHRLIGHLSKGYRQRVGLGQALVHSPKVLILDEPASGLDPAQRVEIRELVRELSAGDVTVVLSTHVLPEVEAICKRVIIIDEGQIVAQDDVTNLQGGGRSIRLRVARPPEDGVAKLGAIEGVGAVERPEDDVFQVEAVSDVREEVARVAVDWGLLELGSRRGLEDVYLQLTAENEVDA